MSYRDFVNSFSVTPVGRWLAKNLASRVDPFIYKVTGGRFTMTGPPTIPMLSLTTIGRKSGKERTVQLGYAEDLSLIHISEPTRPELVSRMPSSA